VVLYAWHPLPIIEFGQSGHNDSLMLGLMLLAIGLAYRQKPLLSAVLLGLAALAKFTPLFGLPLFLVLWHKTIYKGQVSWNFWQIFRPRLWLYPLIPLIILTGGYLPFLIIGQGAIGSLADYLGSWENNPSVIFLGLKGLFGVALAKQISVAGLGLVIFGLAFLPYFATRLSLPRRYGILFTVTFLLASSIHPWYFSWILILLPLVYRDNFPVWWDWGGLLFAFLIPLTYLTYGLEWGVIGKVSEVIIPLIYLPVTLIFLITILSLTRSSNN
jgi:alpha-1,6-mannosyltransferase